MEMEDQDDNEDISDLVELELLRLIADQDLLMQFAVILGVF